nr:hypothetical protein [Micromonospora sp. DSM 115978]
MEGRQLKASQAGDPHPFFLIIYFLIAVMFFSNHPDVVSRLLSGGMMLFISVELARLVWKRWSPARSGGVDEAERDRNQVDE